MEEQYIYETERYISPEEKNLAMFCHLTALVGFIIPFGNIIIPFIIWKSKKDEYPLVDREGKKSLNFQISIAIYTFIALLLMILLIGFGLLIAIAIYQLIAVILASVSVANDSDYQYKLSMKFIS